MTMPMGPPRQPPTMMPTSESAGWILTALRITMGDSRLSATFWATMAMTSVHRAQAGLTKSPSSVPATAESMGPMTGMKCITKVRAPTRPA